CVEPVHLRHAEVHEHHVRLSAPHDVGDPEPVIGRTDHDDVFLRIQQGCEPGPDHRLVVHDEDPDWRAVGAGRSGHAFNVSPGRAPRRRRRSAAAVGAGSAPRGTRSRRTWPNVQSMPPEPSSAAAATRPPRGLSGRLHTPRLRSVRSVRWVWAAAAFVAVVLLAIEWPGLAVLYGLHPAAAMVLAMTHSAAVVLTVRWPLVGIAVSSFGSLATMLATFPMAAVLPWPWPVTGILAHCLLVALLSLRHPW